MNLIDLTRRLDAADAERIPKVARPAATVLVPEVIVRNDPAVEGAEQLCAIFGCTREDLPDGEGWGDERIQINTHLGTHVDAPLHYGTTCEGAPSRTIGDIGLEELYCDGIVLDVREDAKPGEGISVEALKRAVHRSGAEIGPGTAALIRTGQERYDLDDPEFYWYPGMTRAGTLFLAELGAKVLGTDAVGWDRPLMEMRRAFQESGDASEIWDGHFAGRDREVFIVQQLANLASVPTSGFKVGFFPLALAGLSASPARVVAFV